MREDPIDNFRGPYRFLSNTYPVPIPYESRTYASVEHAFQAAKTLDPRQRERIRSTASAAAAKRIGRTVTLRPGWQQQRVDVMAELLAIKFQQPRLRAALQRTVPAPLIEGNYWHDNYWGDCICDHCRHQPGTNMVGQLLMRLRDSDTPPTLPTVALQ